MFGSQSVRLIPLNDLRQVRPGEWVADGYDPQFILEGPFPRGLWELRITGRAPEASGHSALQLYCAERGDFTEAASRRVDGLSPAGSKRCVRFWLPFRAASLRLDPSSEPGPLFIESVQIVRRSVAGVLALEWLKLARRDVRQALGFLLQIVRSLREEPRRAKALVLEFLMGRQIDPYPEWLKRRSAARHAAYPFSPEAGLFSLITTVYDTAPEYIDALAESISAQTYEEFEWIVLDNGSRAPATLAAIDRLAADRRVHLSRVDTNLGIIGGMRHVLERASGRYVLPVDSDDVLFPDALAAIASYAQRRGYPPLLYTDEDKLRDGAHTDPFLKPDWDPVLLRNCCYIAHLTAIDRVEALKLGAYTDPRAEGCHDWDSFLRFVRAGMSAEHVPEILYSWRMHPGSTAADVSAKDYIITSQRHVLTGHLAKTGLGDRLEVVRSPHFPSSPDWWIRRRRVGARALSLVVVTGDRDPGATLLSVERMGGYPLHRVWLVGSGTHELVHTTAEALRSVRPDLDVRVCPAGLASGLAAASQDVVPLLAAVDARLSPRTDEWSWEMIGLKEAFPDAAVIGGRILDPGGRVVAGPLVFGYRGSLGSPDRGRAAGDAGYFGSALKQQTTSAVDGRLCAVDPGFLRAVLGAGAVAPDDIESLGAWLGLVVLEHRGRVVFSPFIEAVAPHGFAPHTQPECTAVDTRYYHPLLSRSDPFALAEHPHL